MFHPGGFDARAPALEVAVRRVKGFDSESLQEMERHVEDFAKYVFSM